MKGLGALLIVGGALFLFLAYTNSIAGVLSALFGGTPAAGTTASTGSGTTVSLPGGPKLIGVVTPPAKSVGGLVKLQ